MRLLRPSLAKLACHSIRSRPQMARASTQALISTQSATMSFVRFSGAFTRRLNRLPDRIYCNCRGRPLSGGFLFLWASNTLTEHYPPILGIDEDKGQGYTATQTSSRRRNSNNIERFSL